MPRDLPDGLYEHIVTDGLARDLTTLETARQREVIALDAADAHESLARHLSIEVARALASVPASERPAAQIEIINRLLSELHALVPSTGDAAADVRVQTSGQELRAIFRTAPPERPSTPLASSTLLTRSRSEPSLGTELGREIASADRIDVIVAFISMGGVRALRAALEEYARRAPPDGLRVLTTVYSGTTEASAVEWLASLPSARIKVSYDVRRTRLHAKAWLFRRETGLHTAYIGSANLTSTALGSGQEWMVKVCSADLPHVVEKFNGKF
jgi:HKD family nuclease